MAKNLPDTKPTMLGYTQEVFMTCLGGNGHFLIREDTDLSDTFDAWCLDTHSFIIVDGYLWEEV